LGTHQKKKTEEEKKAEEEEEKAEAIEKRADGLLRKLEASIGKPLEQVDKAHLIRLIRGIVKMLCRDRAGFRSSVKYLSTAIKLIELRELADKRRIEGRPDQIYKRALQKEAKPKLKNYPTIAAAAKAFWQKPRYRTLAYTTVREKYGLNQE
jgi:hypothetical protein